VAIPRRRAGSPSTRAILRTLLIASHRTIGVPCQPHRLDGSVATKESRGGFSQKGPPTHSNTGSLTYRVPDLSSSVVASPATLHWGSPRASSATRGASRGLADATDSDVDHEASRGEALQICGEVLAATNEASDWQGYIRSAHVVLDKLCSRLGTTRLGHMPQWPATTFVSPSPATRSSSEPSNKATL
jgi:hypothetical protein